MTTATATKQALSAIKGAARKAKLGQKAGAKDEDTAALLRALGLTQEDEEETEEEDDED